MSVGQRAVLGTTDANIRSALYRKRFRHQMAGTNTLVIDELGLAHTRSRIDIAVIKGSVHGYEIKSSKDRLDRLGGQLEIYRQTLQKLTVVAAPRHVSRVLSIIPDWCGLIEAEWGQRGGISLKTLRGARVNPDVDPVMMAHLLWRKEAIELLIQIGYEPRQLRQPRTHLYKMLGESMRPSEIAPAIRAFMSNRQMWRARLQRA